MVGIGSQGVLPGSLPTTGGRVGGWWHLAAGDLGRQI